MMKWLRRVPPPAKGDPRPTATTVEERPKRGVLVVDGSIAAAAAVVQVGDRTNQIVSTAYSIGKAVGLAARFDFKTILFDHEQIDGTGEEFVRQLRDRGLIGMTRLYALTGGNPTVVAMKYVGMPVDDFLTKPVPSAQLANLLALPRKAE